MAKRRYRREFTFDTRSQQYRVTHGPGKGKFIGYDAVVNLTETYIEQSKVEIDDITSRLLNGQMRVGKWERAIAEHLRDAHTNAYALGHGGIGRLGDDEKNEIRDRLRFEFRHLRNFAEEIIDGRLSEAQIRDRVSMYIEGIYRTYAQARYASHYDAGFDQELRVRNATESCQDCIDYEAMGWQPIGALPHPGEDCECRSRCRCHKEYRRLKDVKKSQLLQGHGWIGEQPKMKLNKRSPNTAIKNIGVPTEEQIEAINQHTPMGDITADDVTTLAFYASNNLVRHSNAAWTISALSNMGQLLQGRKFLTDHNWDNVEGSFGKIYDYQLFHSDSAPDAALDVAGMGNINRYITEQHGYAYLVLHAYFRNGSKGLEDFRYGFKDDVSTGTLGNPETDLICPICTEEHGREIRFTERDSQGKAVCPHNVPSPFMLWLFGDDPEMNFAPFYYQNLDPMTGGHGVELSAVVVPNLPVTGIVTPRSLL